jgi:uncharacterized protein YsxB (DUF464 family)
MIRVIVDRAADQAIRSFSVKGHAGFAEIGFDIVCAGVSAVTIGTVNAAEAVLGIHMDSAMKDGFIQASVPGGLDADQSAKLQLQLETMVVMLKSIEQSYRSYIKVQDKTNKRR